MFSKMEKCGVSTILSAFTVAILAGSSLSLALIAMLGALVFVLSYLLYSLK